MSVIVIIHSDIFKEITKFTVKSTMDAYYIPAILASALLQNALCPFGPWHLLVPMPGTVSSTMTNLFLSLNLSSISPPQHSLPWVCYHIPHHVSHSSNLVLILSQYLQTSVIVLHISTKTLSFHSDSYSS